MDGLGLESLRLGGADALRAEKDLQMRGGRSKADTPLKDLEDGLLGIRKVNFAAQVIGGGDQGWVDTEAAAGRIKVEGYHVLRSASIVPVQNHYEYCQIYLSNGTDELVLASGEACAFDHLNWSGEVWLQGTWYIDARQLIGFDREDEYADGQWLYAGVQRMQRGMEAGE